jgi:hypothetical protein
MTAAIIPPPSHQLAGARAVGGGVGDNVGGVGGIDVGIGIGSVGDGVGESVGVGVSVVVGDGDGDGVGVGVGVVGGAGGCTAEDGNISRTASINRPESKKRSSWSTTQNSKVWLPAVVITYEKF